jgi:putative Mn2+ efflux pump MntP
MGTVVLIGFVLGLDSFRASVGLGLVGRCARRVRMALAFGLCDGFSPILGLLLGEAVTRTFVPWVEWVGPVTLGGFGVLTFLTAGRRDSSVDSGGAPGAWRLLGLPLALSLDNLVAGFGLGTIRAPVVASAIILGTVSGAMALAGLYLGSVICRKTPTRAAQLGGASLALLAVGMALDYF